MGSKVQCADLHGSWAERNGLGVSHREVLGGGKAVFEFLQLWRQVLHAQPLHVLAAWHPFSPLEENAVSERTDAINAEHLPFIEAK